jgi:hypothetical protein
MSRRTLERFLTLLEQDSQSPLTFNPMNSLVGDVLELARSVDEFFPNLAGKFDRCQKVAYTETETHLDSGRKVVIVA